MPFLRQAGSSICPPPTPRLACGVAPGPLSGLHSLARPPWSFSPAEPWGVGGGTGSSEQIPPYPVQGRGSLPLFPCWRKKWKGAQLEKALLKLAADGAGWGREAASPFLAAASQVPRNPGLILILPCLGCVLSGSCAQPIDKDPMEVQKTRCAALGAVYFHLTQREGEGGERSQRLGEKNEKTFPQLNKRQKLLQSPVVSWVSCRESLSQELSPLQPPSQAHVREPLRRTATK